MNWVSKKIKVSELKENPKNPRSLTEKGLSDLEKSIKKFGVAEPLVVNTDLMICGGHGRKKILERLNITEVDCYIPEKKDLHPTMKPVALVVNAILNSSKLGNIVSDSFLGSGTTLIACEQTKRICYGMEIDTIYIDVILKRYKKLYPDSSFKCLNRKFDFEKLFEEVNLQKVA